MMYCRYLRVFGWQQAAAAIGGQLNALQMQEAPAAEENQRQPLKAESLTGCGSVMNRQIPTDVLHSQSYRLKVE